MKDEVRSSTSVDKREVLEGRRLVGLFSMLLPFALLLALVLFSLSPCDDGIFKLSDASVCGLFLSVSIVAVRARSGVRGRGFDPSFCGRARCVSHDYRRCASFGSHREGDGRAIMF